MGESHSDTKGTKTKGRLQNASENANYGKDNRGHLGRSRVSIEIGKRMRSLGAWPDKEDHDADGSKKKREKGGYGRVKMGCCRRTEANATYGPRPARNQFRFASTV